MIYELRIYSCKAGTTGVVLDMWKNEGQAMIEPYMKMVGQWVSESGIASQIYTIWEFDSFDHRQQARAALLAHPGFLEYVNRCRDYYLQQESIFLSPTDLSPIGNLITYD